MKICLDGRQARTGFSLLELIAVMTIISIVSAIAIAGFSSINSSLSLSSAAQLLSNEITLGRQIALTNSETVEVRFYEFPDANTATNQFQAIQTFSTNDEKAFTPLDKISFLPSIIMIDCSPLTSGSADALSYPFNEVSSSLNPLPYTPNGTINGLSTTGALPLPGSVGMGYTYRSLRFKPSGGIDYLMPSGAPADWPPTTWYITIYEKKYAAVSSKALIRNFITVSVDSITGRVRLYQP